MEEVMEKAYMNCWEVKKHVRSRFSQGQDFTSLILASGKDKETVHNSGYFTNNLNLHCLLLLCSSSFASLILLCSSKC